MPICLSIDNAFAVKTIYNAVEDFDKTCDEVVQNCGPVIITRKNDDNVVLVSQEEYNNLLENVYIRRNKANYTRLTESIKEAKAGKLIRLDIE
ncbi:MAG: type II toxin-antitoxin system Phd/YefM family antitoxin [Clostridiales bacterium]|nr:type II toxin-antitoxin system Phd/YefM family antitoxin [Clostridiales bacterium]